MKTMVVLSGGMDSATLLYHLRAEGHDCQAFTVWYGQRHAREVLSARDVAAAAGVVHHVVYLDVGLFGKGNALTGAEPVPHGHYADESMRNTVVPNRNMVLLALAAARAISEDCSAVAYGAHAGDHAIYPDCRGEFIRAMQHAMDHCHYGRFGLAVPFMLWSKGMIAHRGWRLGVPFHLTWTCYEGGEVHCGRCGACVERREALAEIPGGDPTPYAV